MRGKKAKKAKKAEGHSSTRVVIPSEREFIRETLKGASFTSEPQFIEQVIDQMNAGKARDFYHWEEPGKRKFLRVKCSICRNFQLWFGFKRGLGGAITDITLARSINQAHIADWHRQGDF
jgi:hypothetical protein